MRVKAYKSEIKTSLDLFDFQRTYKKNVYELTKATVVYSFYVHECKGTTC